MKPNKSHPAEERITTALLLAAGTGSRLFPLTKASPKCLTMVNDTSILERLVTSLEQHGFKRLVVVTGHLEKCIRKFLKNRPHNLTIEYIFSPPYKTTNNIYSLWMAREMINEPFLLIESDLVFDPSLLTKMLVPDRIAIASMKPWLNGSMVTINQFNKIDGFYTDTSDTSTKTKYKTVNIYSLSLTSWYNVVEVLNQFILAGRTNDYYEAVFRQLVTQKRLSFQAVFFDEKPWYEIDTIEDLASAERLFPLGYNKTGPFFATDTSSFKTTRQPVSEVSLEGLVHDRL